MSSDTANLLREHVKATADLLTNAKPDREESDSAGISGNDDANAAGVRKKGSAKPSQ